MISPGPARGEASRSREFFAQAQGIFCAPQGNFCREQGIRPSAQTAPPGQRSAIGSLDWRALGRGQPDARNLDPRMPRAMVLAGQKLAGLTAEGTPPHRSLAAALLKSTLTAFTHPAPAGFLLFSLLLQREISLCGGSATFASALLRTRSTCFAGDLQVREPPAGPSDRLAVRRSLCLFYHVIVAILASSQRNYNRDEHAPLAAAAEAAKSTLTPITPMTTLFFLPQFGPTGARKAAGLITLNLCPLRDRAWNLRGARSVQGVFTYIYVLADGWARSILLMSLMALGRSTIRCGYAGRYYCHPSGGTP